MNTCSHSAKVRIDVRDLIFCIFLGIDRIIGVIRGNARALLLAQNQNVVSSALVTRRVYSAIAVRSMETTVTVHQFRDIDAQSGVVSGATDVSFENRT